MYLDDIESGRGHRFGGELLAVEEFNEMNPTIKIDVWRGVRNFRPFPDAVHLGRMFIAHDLEALSRSANNRDPINLKLVSSRVRL